jgi:hypothetical protein
VDSCDSVEQVYSITWSALSQVELQWWRDHTQIKYDVAPNITLRMVEGRLMRAVACCGAHTSRRFEAVPIWREIGQAAAALLANIENNSSPDLIIPRFQPLPADEDDFCTVYGALPAGGEASELESP